MPVPMPKERFVDRHFDISVVMPVCSWPDPADENGAAHPQLRRALDSIVEAVAGDKPPTVELIIGVDGHRPRVTDLIYDWMTEHPQILTTIFECEKSPVCTWGNTQRNTILDTRWAIGRLIVWQDQDDRFFPRALSRVVAEANEHPGQPLIFKMQVCADRNNSDPFILWKDKGRVERNHIGGHMLVVPNVPDLIGRWQPVDSYAADFDFIKSTLDKFLADGRPAHWSEEYISLLRPHVMAEG